jgi:glycerol-3-phosphate dehydrogenase (NAD(P)+)
MVDAGASLVAASTEESLAAAIAEVFIRAGVVCEESSDPLGVELAGAAKNAAALASGATEAQGLNAAGGAAGHIFGEVWRWAESQGARPESLIGLAGVGDLVATALAPQSRNRRAGELLAQGVPAVDIPVRIGQAVEALESVPLLARALTSAGIDAPVTTALGRLIAGAGLAKRKRRGTAGAHRAGGDRTAATDYRDRADRSHRARGASARQRGSRSARRQRRRAG